MHGNDMLVCIIILVIRQHLTAPVRNKRFLPKPICGCLFAVIVSEPVVCLLFLEQAVEQLEIVQVFFSSGEE